MDLGLRGARAAYCRGRPAPYFARHRAVPRAACTKRRGVIKSMILRVLPARGPAGVWCHRKLPRPWERLLQGFGASTECVRGRMASDEPHAACLVRLPAANVHTMCTSAFTPHPLITTAQLTCPVCGHVSSETMPLDACIYYHDCAGCGTLLRPRAGDCCVFCSYGTVPCPPVQAQQPCCGTHRKP